MMESVQSDSDNTIELGGWTHEKKGAPAFLSVCAMAVPGGCP